MNVATEALLVTSVAHAAFQVTVTTLVYPALAECPAEHWHRVHDRHTRRITPLVAAVYVPLAGACTLAAWRLLKTSTSSSRAPAAVQSATVSRAGALTALLGAAGAAVVTALGAAPTHRRLSGRHDPVLVRTLLVQDRWRAGLAAAGAIGAVAASTRGTGSTL